MSSIGDEALLREFAGRLIASPFGVGDTDIEVELFPGAIPADPERQLLLPAGARLVGSALQRRDGEPANLQVVIDSDAPLAKLMATYEEDLFRHGWKLDNQRFGARGGFISMGYPWRTYAKDDSGPLLTVMGGGQRGDSTELRLRLDFEIPSGPPPPGPPPGLELIPTLFPPPGVRLEGGGSSGNGGSWYTTAQATTDMPLEALSSYFTDQLTKAGWEQSAKASTDPAVITVWKVKSDEPWRGVFIVMSSNDPRERLLMLHLQGPLPRHGGGYARSGMSRRRR